MFTTTPTFSNAPLAFSVVSISNILRLYDAVVLIEGIVGMTFGQFISS